MYGYFRCIDGHWQSPRPEIYDFTCHNFHLGCGSDLEVYGFAVLIIVLFFYGLVDVLHAYSIIFAYMSLFAFVSLAIYYYFLSSLMVASLSVLKLCIALHL